MRSSKIILINPIDRSVVKVYRSGESVDLTADMNVWIEETSTAIIPHPEILGLEPGSYLIVPVAGIFLSHTLIIPTEHFDVALPFTTDSDSLHELHTPVFNFGNKRVRIEKGSVISRLVAL